MPAPIVAAAPALSPFAAAAGGLATGLVTSAFNAFQGESSRDYNREMASSSHQREVADLRKAGLNPILSAGGSGTSVAPSPTPQAGNFEVVGKSIEAMQLRNQTRLTDAQINDINSAAALKEIDGRIKLQTEDEQILMAQLNLEKLIADTDLSKEQRLRVMEELQNLKVQRDLIRAQTSHSAAQAGAVEADAEKKKAMSKPFEYLNKGIEAVETNSKSWYDKAKRWFKDDVDKSKRRHDGKTGRW